MAPALHLPPWTVTVAVILLVIGFPISAILSWIFDFTAEGFTKTESIGEEAGPKPDPVPVKRKIKGSNVLIVVLFIVVFVLLYPKVFSRDKFEQIRSEDGRISIAVMPFQNMTNDTHWDIWQVGIQNELITNLSNSTELSVRQYQSMQEILQNKDQSDIASISSSEASDISRKLEANTFIQGSIKIAGKSFRLNAHLIDSNSEEIFKTFQMEGDGEEDIFMMTDSLSRLVRNHLEIKAMEQGVDYDLRMGYATNSAQSYRLYIEGLDAFFSNDFATALERLNQSIEIDVSFFAAYEWLLKVYNAYGFVQQDYAQIQQAKDLLEIVINWNVENLTRMEQIALKMIIAKYVDKSPREYILLYRQMLEIDPQQRMVWYELGLAYESIEQYENAVVAFENAVEISNQWEISDKWVQPYKHWIHAYHKLGNHQEEQEVLKMAWTFFPNDPEISYEMLLCSLSEGDTAKANEYFEVYESARRKDLFWTHTEAIHRLAHQYDRASMEDEAERIWREVIKSEPHSSYHQRCFAEFLILNDVNVEEGLELVNGILESNPEYYDILYFKGVGLYKQGDLEAAQETLTRAWDRRLTYRHDHYLALREVELALAGR